MKRKILLIDDEHIFHFLHVKVFERSGIDCDIETASNGSEALAVIKGYLAGVTSVPDFIFVDLNMPVMDGFEFIRVFQQMDIPDKEKVTIVILTSSMHSDDIKRAVNLGIERYITKPMTEEDVSRIFSGI